jgi:hypothetical protein
MQVNNIEVVDRNTRPAVLQRVLLRTFFVNDGEFQDPYQVSSVTIYKKAQNTSPSSILNADNLIDDTKQTASALMVFAPSSDGHHTHGVVTASSLSAFDASNYTGVAGLGSSSVYRLSQGEYAVVLDGTLLTSLSGVTHDNTKLANGVDSATDYIDVWTVKQLEASNFKTIIHYFTLHDDSFINITEPLLIKTKNRLTNKHVTLGSKIALKISTETTVENENITDDIKNIFKDTVITSAMVKIEKANDGSHLPSRVEVSGFSDTSALVDVTGDNTLVLTWDTNKLATHTNVAQFGGLVGNYFITVKYDVLNETIISPPMALILS